MENRKQIDIEKIKVIQAPLAGVSDKVFRYLIRKYYSNCLMTTEMISSELLVQNPNPRIIEFEEFEYPLAFQLVGHKVDIMTKAAKIIAPCASIIDINCGCPVRKVALSGDGCGLMKNPDLAFDIIQSIKEETKLPISVKMRLGWNQQEENFIDFAKIIQRAGASFVTLHARTRAQMYEGSADWEKIALLVKELSIPVFANGDIKTLDDAIQCLEITKAQGVSIGRGILGDFTLLNRIERYIEKREILPPPNLAIRIDMLKRHLRLEVERLGEANGVKFVRKFYSYYISSIKNAAKYRSILVTLKKESEVIEVLDEILSIYYKND